MPTENPRIAELRRRVQADPASIAFGQLAEEYRRAGQYQEAVQCCRTGLTRHPGYLSARVTLGRALTELGSLDEAAREFEFVLRSAPDNLAAIRGIAEIHQRGGAMVSALEYYKRALELARFDPDLEETVQRIERELGEVSSRSSDRGMSFEQAQTELLSAAARVPLASPSSSDDSPLDFDALLASLGVPDAAPPPATEMLLQEPAPAVPSEPLLPELPSETPATDPFATLEVELRALDSGLSAEAPPVAPEAKADLSAEAPAESSGAKSDLSAEAPKESSGAKADAATAGPPPAGASSQPRQMVPAGDELNDVLAELESWLQALASDRPSPPAA